MSGNFTYGEFQRQMSEVNDLIHADPGGAIAPYWRGYRWGLMRTWYGTAYGTEEEHERMLAMAEDFDDVDRFMCGIGYRDGLAFGKEGRDEDKSW